MNMEDLYRLLRTSHVQAQGIVDTVADPMLVLDANLTVQNASRAFFETFKVDRYETIGQPLFELGNGQWDIPELRRLLLEVIPKATAVINYQVDHVFPGLGPRTMLLTARKLVHPDNASHSMLLSIIDATDRFRRDAAKDLLLGEMRHRMKNLFSVVQSLARQTTTDGRTAKQYRDDFLGRFGALMEAEDLAFVTQDETALLKLLQRILAPYKGGPAVIAIESGPAVVLAPRSLGSLSLVLHELATNAAKYGALSAPGGQVRVTWAIDADKQELRLSWVETGGPAVTPPASTGYGTELIRSVTSYSLGGRSELDYAVEGLRAEIIIPLRSESLPS
ncbi:PAS domain-containing protein [Rhodopseudomonas sp. BR0C11]|uniref:HWE histidine kinase domain-containing protein n=1 Tax=Rhodopseudomonas sp. BR0C11 TaxID=2269370 RepID=UPI0013E053E2|nr:HWE histidine kinase domain-containing protein [Rhodopseudomonas sp. BR0C11]NEV76209.1 PAS domain-containing protein [Rhodopseudomonas sp. BR0C11]